MQREKMKRIKKNDIEGRDIWKFEKERKEKKEGEIKKRKGKMN